MKQLQSIEDLAAAPYNPRTIGEAELAGLGKSLNMYGDISGIVWNATTGHLVTGHQRMRSLRARYGADLSLDPEAKVLRAPGGLEFKIRVVEWDDDTERAANIAANSPDIAGRFDTEKLAAMLKDMKERGLSLENTALSAKMVNGLLREKPGGQDAGATPGAVLKEKYQAAVGQVWRLGDHVVGCRRLQGQRPPGAPVWRPHGQRYVDGPSLRGFLRRQDGRVSVERAKASRRYLKNGAGDRPDVDLFDVGDASKHEPVSGQRIRGDRDAAGASVAHLLEVQVRTIGEIIHFKSS